jgi:hypothetical protein
MINLVLVLWILACILFVVWSSGKLDVVWRFVTRKACDLIVWAKGTWHK